METPHEATLLRTFIGESDRYEHRPLDEAIILKTRQMHLAGATALRGPIGFGKSSRLHFFDGRSPRVALPRRHSRTIIKAPAPHAA